MFTRLWQEQNRQSLWARCFEWCGLWLSYINCDSGVLHRIINWKKVGVLLCVWHILCVYISVWDMDIQIQVNMCMEVESQCEVSSLVSHYLMSLRQSLSLNLELTDSTRKQDPGGFNSLCPCQRSGIIADTTTHTLWHGFWRSELRSSCL